MTDPKFNKPWKLGKELFGIKKFKRVPKLCRCDVGRTVEEARLVKDAFECDCGLTVPHQHCTACGGVTPIG